MIFSYRKTIITAQLGLRETANKDLQCLWAVKCGASCEVLEWNFSLIGSEFWWSVCIMQQNGNVSSSVLFYDCYNIYTIIADLIPTN